jgi:hypothetical protein
MATPPLSETIEVRRGTRRIHRRVLTRVAWLAADLGAIAACAAIALRL